MLWSGNVPGSGWRAHPFYLFLCWEMVFLHDLLFSVWVPFFLFFQNLFSSLVIVRDREANLILFSSTLSAEIPDFIESIHKKKFMILEKYYRHASLAHSQPGLWPLYLMIPGDPPAVVCEHRAKSKPRAQPGVAPNLIITSPWFNLTF